MFSKFCKFTNNVLKMVIYKNKINKKLKYGMTSFL
jgi:hypothetical protein